MPLGPCGVVVQNAASSLEEVESEQVRDLLRAHGVVLFRGFSADDAMFSGFTKRFSSSFVGLLHRPEMRESVDGDGATSTVTVGSQLIAHHQEMGYSPVHPDLLWFLCITPAKNRGETFVCDGAALWEQMDDDLRDQFRREKVVYRFRRAGPDVWCFITGFDCTQEQALSAFEVNEGISARANADGTIDIDYRVSAVVRTRYGGTEAFVNSVIVQKAGSVYFEDGTPILRPVQMRLLELATPLSSNIRWQPGDIAMIDNTRCLHGRNGFADSGRQIHVRMSYANF